MGDFIGFKPAYKPQAPLYEHVRQTPKPNLEQIKQWMLYNKIRTTEEYESKQKPQGFPNIMSGLVAA